MHKADTMTLWTRQVPQVWDKRRRYFNFYIKREFLSTYKAENIVELGKGIYNAASKQQ